MARIFLPPTMRPLAGGSSVVDAEGSRLGQVIINLERKFPGMKRYLIDEPEFPDRIRLGMAAFVDGELADLGLLHPVLPESEVHFLPAMSGG